MAAKKRKCLEECSEVDRKAAKINDLYDLHFEYELTPDTAEALLKTPSYSLSPTSVMVKDVGLVRFGQRCKQFPRVVTNCQSLDSFGVTSKLVENYEVINDGKASPIQKFLFNTMFRYMDLYCASNASNHMGCLNEEEIEKSRDQGFVRPKVLILCPMRKDAYNIVDCLKRLIFGDSDKTFVSNFHRFKAEFGDNGYRISEHKILSFVSDEYRVLMSGNNDDCFRLGVSIAKRGIRLYTAFEKSDIILASPLGIRLIIGEESELDRKVGFLSSIEVLIIDKAEIILMQNWEQLLHVIDSLHCPPEKIDVDLSRIRKWALDQRAKLYRQTLVFSSTVLTECRALFVTRCLNFAGFAHLIPHSDGLISKIEVPFSQELRRFEVGSAENQSEERLKFFKTKILSSCPFGTLIFIPSYFDFVKIRNHLKREDESFVQLHEYAKQGKVAKARGLFLHGKKKIILITERFHFYRRFNIKGVKLLVFYQPPVIPSFYHDFINMVTVSGRVVVRLIYCIFDADRMKNIFGDTYSEKLLNSVKNAHVLVSE